MSRFIACTTRDDASSKHASLPRCNNAPKLAGGGGTHREIVQLESKSTNHRFVLADFATDLRRPDDQRRFLPLPLIVHAAARTKIKLVIARGESQTNQQHDLR